MRMGALTTGQQGMLATDATAVAGLSLQSVVAQNGTEFFSQETLAEVDARFDRAAWDAEDIGDLLIGEPFEISQDDRDAIVRWESINSPTDEVLQLLGFEQ